MGSVNRETDALVTSVSTVRLLLRRFVRHLVRVYCSQLI